MAPVPMDVHPNRSTPIAEMVADHIQEVRPKRSTLVAERVAAHISEVLLKCNTLVDEVFSADCWRVCFVARSMCTPQRLVPLEPSLASAIASAVGTVGVVT
jgi:hypothetical protein